MMDRTLVKLIASNLLFFILVDLCAAHEASARDDCSIFMAPASMKGNSGYGLYTTRDVSRGEQFLTAPDSPSIPVLDYGSEYAPTESEAKAREHFFDTFRLYWWGHGKPDLVDYMSEQTVDYQVRAVVLMVEQLWYSLLLVLIQANWF